MKGKILIFNWMDIKNPNAGGQEKYCFEIGKRLARDGMSVYWITSRFPNSSSHEIFEGIHIIRSGSIYSVFLTSILKYFTYRKESYVIISMNSIPFLLPFSRKMRTVVLHHRIDIRVMVQKVRAFGLISYCLQEYINPVIFRHDQILTNSLSSKLDFESIGYKNVEIVKLGVDLPVNSSLTKRKLCISPGPVKPWKHHEIVIKVFSSMPSDWELSIFGTFESEEYRKSLYSLCSNLKIKERVHFLGKISDEELKLLYEQSSICILGTEKEGWGLVAMEAQSYGCPIVAFDVPGIRDSVINGVTGILVKFGDEVEMVKALNLLSSDVKTLRRLSINAIDRSKGFSWEECYRDFMQKVSKYFI
jgi:glycosyltransferase involved in cell wall biosynthesis